MRKLTFTLVFFAVLHAQLVAQVLVNQVWTSSSGQPDAINFPSSEWEDIDWSSSIKTSSNELVVVGNTLQASGNTDILTTKLNNEGQILWEQTFAGAAGGYDYGLVVTLDNSQNILVAGAVTTSSQTTDFALLKYSPTGTLLWSSIIDGGTNQFDIATALVVDAYDNIYLTGATISLLTQADWYITKLNSSGTQLWSTYYDYAGLQDVPLTVRLISGGNHIAVGGFSNSSADVWDFAELRFSGSTGSVLSENREEIPDLSISDAALIAFDGDNNIYIAGTTTGFTDGNKDIQLLKMNDAFEVEWIQTIDAEGLEDKSKSIAIDSEGNVIVAGNSKKTNGGTQITISKFSDDGDLIFKRDYLASKTFQVAEVSKIKVNDDGDIFVAGSVDRNGSRDFVTLMYDSEGALLFEKFYNGEGETKDIAINIDIISGGEILVTGKSDGALTTQYTTVKYEILKRSEEIVLVDDEPHHRANEIIVKFLPRHVKEAFVDDRSKRYGSIFDILKFEAAEEISDRIELTRVNFAKVFPRLSTAHTQSITRLGDTIPIPEFWSVFLIVLEAEQDLDELIADFEEMSEYVVYAHLNHVYQYQTIPDDPLFTEGHQSSLFPTAEFPNAHINVEPAWDIETGQSYVRVGVFDTPIRWWLNEDFGYTTSLSGTPIKDGFNYFNQSEVTSILNPTDSHGTAVAGIIGALRDNGKGIAGIAGGGFDAEGNFNEGVSLHSMGVGVDFFLETAAAIQAIVEGAMDANAQPKGFGQHVQNHSWGGLGNASLENAVKFAWRNECIFIAGRGNAGNNVLFFPACYNDDWVINVGGSGTDGEYFNGANGNNWSPDPFSVSSWGGEVDIIAPGVTENVISLINNFFPIVVEDAAGNNINPPPFGWGDSYQAFGGTSAATPHVSGVAALMYSKHHVNQGQPNNLAPEDVEFILQRYATDIATGEPFNYPAGYDEFNGWGRLNAFESLRRVEGPQWQVYHNGAPNNVQKTTAVNQEWTINSGVVANLPFGIYYGDRVTVTHTYTDVFPATTQIVDHWIRWSGTDGVSAVNPVSGELWADFNFSFINVPNAVVVTTTVTTNALHIKSNTAGQNLNIWYPAHPDDLRAAYSLHLFDPQATGVENISKLGDIEIFPNPTEDKITVQYSLVDERANLLQIRDITGKLLHSLSLDNEINGDVTVDLSQLSAGIYLCQLYTDKGVLSRKVIKQ